MKRLVLLVVCLWVSCMQWLPAAETAEAPPCFKIPSQEDIGSNEAIASYREQWRPQPYFPESDHWIAADIAMLTTLLLAGGMVVWRHVPFKRLWPLPVVTLLYFGMIRGGCICPVGAVANLSLIHI